MTHNSSSWHLQSDWNAYRILCENAPLIVDLYLFYKGKFPSWVRSVLEHWSIKAQTYVSEITNSLGFSPFYTEYVHGKETVNEERYAKFQAHFVKSEHYQQIDMSEDHGKNHDLSLTGCFLTL